MKYTVVCDETNNGYGEELKEEVIADFKFERDPKTYRVTFVPLPGVDFLEMRQKFFERLHEVLEPCSAEDIGEMIFSANVRNKGY